MMFRVPLPGRFCGMSRLRSTNNTEASQAQTIEATGEGGWIIKVGPCVRQVMAGAVLLLGTALLEVRGPTNTKQAVVLGTWW